MQALATVRYGTPQSSEASYVTQCCPARLTALSQFQNSGPRLAADSRVMTTTYIQIHTMRHLQRGLESENEGHGRFPRDARDDALFIAYNSLPHTEHE